MNIKLLEESFELIKPQAQAFSISFYDYLFQHNPELKVLFINVDREAQEKKLIFSLMAIIENLRNPQILEVALKSLGARHFQVGTLEKHYPLVGKALLETFSSYLGTAWTVELAYTWSQGYETIANIMLEGAKDPQAYLEPELTFYDWIDLYGEENKKWRETIASLTNFQYGKKPTKENIQSI